MNQLALATVQAVNRYRLPWLTLSVLGLCCLLAVAAPLGDASAAAPTDSLFWALVLSSEDPPASWRWLSAHLLHTGPSHLSWNALALLILGCLIERSPGGREQLLAGTLAGASAVTIWFYGFAESRYYCGLSGLLNTLFVLALATADRAAPKQGNRQTLRPLLIALLIGAFARAAYELWQGAPLLPRQEWPSAPGAHLAGLLAGVLLVRAQRPD